MGPLVTVLLPVYNGSLFLRESIDSILRQTYTNIDLLLIDDGSTDDSLDIIASYTDSRIRLEKNEKNMGLTATFNKGVDLSRGKYVARMDADDIALDTRLEKQVAYLESHPEVTMIDTIMEYIDKDGNPLHKFNSDAVSPEDIVSTLPKYNCLGHSSIMIRLAVYKQYKYNKIAFEDYELWLRLVNDNRIIHKIAEPLLLYRLHSNSYTDASKSDGSHAFKAGITKRYYLGSLPFAQRFRKFNLQVWTNMIKDYLKGSLKYFRQKLRK